MGDGIEVDDDQVKRAVDGLVDAASDLLPAQERAGRLLLDKAGTKVPRRSGRLAASGRVDAASDETRVVYDEVYAGVIHNGWPARNIKPQPWLSVTVEESADLVKEAFVDHFLDAISR